MDVAERIAKVKEQTNRLFVHEDFDNPEKIQHIMAPMPAHQDYLRAMVLLRGNENKGDDLFHGCYAYPLLTAEQEFQLFRQYNYCKYRAIKCLPTTGLFRAEKWLERMAEIGKNLAGANIRLGVKTVRKYRSLQMYEDLLSDANLMICRTINYFDWRKGNKFSTYLTWCLIRYLKREAGKNYYTHGSNVSLTDELAECLKDKYDEQEVNVNEHAHNETIVKNIMEDLSSRDKKIIQCLFFNNMTLEATGSVVGISKERVRQLRVQILDTMRNKLELVEV